MTCSPTSASLRPQITYQRTQRAPWGLEGGRDGLPNKLGVRRASGEHEQFPNGKVSALRLAAGEAYVLYSGGGGGYGSPLDRPAERVADDVREGYVSPEAAHEQYGVVLDPATLAVDEPATAARRAALRGAAASGESAANNSGSS